MKETFVETRNYIQMHEMMDRLVNQLEGNQERMGLAYGTFGLGKTFSLERLAMEFDALLLRTRQTWTVSSVLRLLAQELGIDTHGKSSELQRRITNAMNYAPRPIIIDEIDALLYADRFRVMELFRDIHDQTGIVTVFVGMESCDARLKNHPHFYSRIVAKVKFQPIPVEDISRFCEQAEIGISKDLVEYFHRKYPNLRQIKVFLLRLEAWAELNGVDRVDLKLFRQSGVEKMEL